MASKKGTAGRFGARYGNTLRRKVSDIEGRYRKGADLKCPFSGKSKKVKRVASGIWVSKVTGKKFVGKAYQPE